MFIDVTIENLGELIDAIESLHKEKPEQLWYRGHADMTWELKPYVYRHHWTGVEQPLTNDFYTKASMSISDSPNKDDYSAWITIMQHFGLPTRLLDWSMSPLIAAYFATESHNEATKMNDACIWVLRPDRLNKINGFKGYIYHMNTKTVQDMVYPAFKHISIQAQPMYIRDKIIACKPTNPNIRIYSQQAAFTLHNTESALTSFNDEQLLGRIIIPNKRCAHIMRELSICGITHSALFPEAENIAIELKKHYGFI